ncbi:MAG: 4Fe-4S binding protein [Ignavibacteria bacterium]|jgi:NAD-dependent dihydropyrimidine dehydrogenase PreA subunit/copper chaperone CopZ|nr:4Fe-4S binding protein [Ignavibacteria bacterium]MCU7503864.1 4Fe-4S binding protein [Ignavibacteria bacterium]MCU7515915.1 4Fe-4S binding protein [Ignavibacteria bacterium]
MKNKVRLIFQFIFLGLVGYVAIRPAFDKGYAADFEKYCPYGGIGSFMSKLNQGTMACTMGEVQVALGIGLLIGVLLVGKLFCSYACPIGTVTEWLGRLGDKLKIRREMPKLLDRPFRALKYVVLFLALYFTMTSSELFCKEFDPYFASANLFGNGDTVLYLAVPAFVLAILGAVFFRLFWCRYLCPLGAISNVFMNVIGSGSVIILFIIAKYFMPGLGYVWLVGGLAASGLVTELGFMKSFLSPLPKITRDASKCTSCGLCDRKCPQGIMISKLEKVNHIDCTLCSDCVKTCPKKDTLTINNKKNLKHLAPVAFVVILLLSLGAASRLNFTTISERWGNFASVSNVATYEQSGLKNVKCFSSSMALKGKLETVEGIVGLDTWASAHAVKIYYDPSKITEQKVKASLFTPTKQEVHLLKDPSLTNLAMWQVGVNHLFDLYDFIYLTSALKQDPAVYGFETHYGEPIMLTVFYDASKTNPAKIKQKVELKEVEVKMGKLIQNVKIDFEVQDDGKVLGSIAVPDYKKRIFKLYDRTFNDYKEYDKSQLEAFVFPMPESTNPALRQRFSSLTSHLSADQGVVRFSTRYLDVPSAIIYFDPSKTNVEKIKKALGKPVLTIFTSDTETKDIPNPFHIKPDGKTLKASELSIDEDEKI